MSSLNTKQRNALAWYCVDKNLRPELSAYPDYRFTDKSSGDKLQHNIKTIVSEYEEFKKEETKLKAAERRREKAEEKSLGRRTINL